MRDLRVTGSFLNPRASWPHGRACKLGPCIAYGHKVSSSRPSLQLCQAASQARTDLSHTPIPRPYSTYHPFLSVQVCGILYPQLVLGACRHTGGLPGCFLCC